MGGKVEQEGATNKEKATNNEQESPYGQVEPE
jgi:hypothetical protein